MKQVQHSNELSVNPETRQCYINDLGHSHTALTGLTSPLPEGRTELDIFLLGGINMYGLSGAPHDPDYGSALVILAAEAGLEVAQAFAIAFYFKGTFGFPQDLDIATGWFAGLVDTHG